MIWLQLAAFFPLAILGWVAGRRVASRGGWGWGVAATFLILLLVILGHRWPRAAFVPPVSWAVHPDVSPLLMTATIALLFGTLLPRLPVRRRVAVRLVTGIMLLNYGLLPAALPLAARSALASTQTHLDRQGVCKQTHAYTCGPAAAVTCLGRLGIRAEEGELAVAARCGPVVGTHGGLLAGAIMERFPDVEARYRYVEALDDLQMPAAAEMIMPVIGGHFVAVLEVGPEFVVVGDPMSGRGRVPRERFREEWTGAAVEMVRRALSQ